MSSISGYLVVFLVRCYLSNLFFFSSNSLPLILSVFQVDAFFSQTQSLYFSRAPFRRDKLSLSQKKINNLCVYCIIGSKGRKHPYNLNSKLPLSSISVCLVFFSCDCFVCWGLLVLINNNADPSRPALKRRPSPDYTRN